MCIYLNETIFRILWFQNRWPVSIAEITVKVLTSWVTLNKSVPVSGSPQFLTILAQSRISVTVLVKIKCQALSEFSAFVFTSASVCSILHGLVHCTCLSLHIVWSFTLVSFTPRLQVAWGLAWVFTFKKSLWFSTAPGRYKKTNWRKYTKKMR